MSYSDVFPAIDIAIDLEPEELGMLILKDLSQEKNLSRHNYTLNTNPGLRSYAFEKIDIFCERLVEGWMWLEKEMLLAPRPGSDGQWFFITRRGRALLESDDLLSYKLGINLNFSQLDPVLARKVKPLFLRGDYDTAVFQAFKEVEIRVRKKGNYSNSELGVDLIRKAFKTSNGPLTDKDAEEGEKESISHLFAGSIGYFKNPSSHRDVQISDPNEASDIIGIANQLLRMIERFSS